MSDSERPDLVAFRELEHLVQLVHEEMAALRKRAQQAEAALREQTESVPRSATRGDGRQSPLEKENADLRARLDGAAARTRQLLDRMRFLRQQHETGSGR